MRKNPRRGWGSYPENLENQAANRKAAEEFRALNPLRNVMQATMAKLTNHDRNLYARAGYPGLRNNNLVEFDRWLNKTFAWRGPAAVPPEPKNQHAEI